MAIGAIMSSILLDVTLTTTNISNTSTTTTNNCLKAFNLLRAIITKWINDYQQHHDLISDSLLTSLHRYLCGYGDSYLYDPNLKDYINTLMSKLFKKLLMELKTLGTKVIFADMNRIIVNTNKTNMNSAKEYIHFILDTINNSEMFHYIEVC